MDILYVAIAAAGGGILAALIGWADSGEQFNGRKFLSSGIRALISGGAFAIAYSLTGPAGIMDILIAVVAGAGVDVLGNRTAGVIKGDRG